VGVASHIKALRRLVSGFFPIAKQAAEEAKDRLIATYHVVDPTIAFAEFELVAESLRNVAAYLESVASAQIAIPEELYETTQWFLDQCLGAKGKTVPYALTSHAELSTLEFRQFLAFHFVDLAGTPTFIELMDKVKESFYFIQLPQVLLREDSSSDWPLVFHECGHVIDESLALVSSQEPSLASRSRVRMRPRRGRLSAWRGRDRILRFVGI
jgi:hypothetical protein